jgi:MerR family transcriptional regulator, redox-sensitive transcriptional activator SoxR
MQELTIGEVAARAGVRASTLRYYESVGLLSPPTRESGRRRYDPDVLQRLSVINLAKEAGLTIEEIRVLLHGFDEQTPPSTRWRTLAEQKLVEVDALIVRAERMKRLLEVVLECECPTLEHCASAIGKGDNERESTLCQTIK